MLWGITALIEEVLQLVDESLRLMAVVNIVVIVWLPPTAVNLVAKYMTQIKDGK